MKSLPRPARCRCRTSTRPPPRPAAATARAATRPEPDPDRRSGSRTSVTIAEIAEIAAIVRDADSRRFLPSPVAGIPDRRGWSARSRLPGSHLSLLAPPATPHIANPQRRSGAQLEKTQCRRTGRMPCCSHGAGGTLLAGFQKAVMRKERYAGRTVESTERRRNGGEHYPRRGPPQWAAKARPEETQRAGRAGRTDHR